MIFYLSFIAFILSIIAGVVLMLVGKNMGRERFRILASLHFLLLLAFLASLLLRQSQVSVNNYFFTAYFCSGIILSGIAIRLNIQKFLRYYFTLFLLGIPMFLLSPSMMMNFLVTTSYSSTTGKTFHLTGRYYLEQQNSSEKTDNNLQYKVITKTGMFHKTIKRDIVFQGDLDSVKVIEKNQTTMIIRGYISRKTYVSEDIDSADVEITLMKNKQGTIEYRL